MNLIIVVLIFKALFSLAESMPSLRQLGLVGCKSVKNVDVVQLLVLNPELSVLQ